MRIRDLGPDAGGAASITNPNDDWLPLNGATTGAGVSLVSGAGANGLGAYAALGTVPVRTCAIRLTFGPGSNGAHRLAIQLSKDAGATTFGPLIWIGIASARRIELNLPLDVAAATTIHAAIQGSVGALPVSVMMEYLPASATRAPGFTDMVSLTTLGASTRPSGTPVQVSISPTVWTEVVAASAVDIGSLLMTWGEIATPTSFQTMSVGVATGALAAEVEVDRSFSYLSTAVPYAPGFIRSIRKPFAAGTRFSINMRGANNVGAPGPDTAAFCLIGFRNP